MSRQVPPSGNPESRIMIVGEAPGADEEAKGEPFVGVSGFLMNKMLEEAKISRSECFITNVVRQRPFKNDIEEFIPKTKKAITNRHRPLREKWVTPEVIEGFDLLRKEIAMVKPNVIVAFGGTPLWALTGKSGIKKWRGSMLETDMHVGPESFKVIPTWHPAAVSREWYLRATTVNDLKRVRRFAGGLAYPKPSWRFIIRPTFTQAYGILKNLYDRLQNGEILRVSFDLETRAGHIACAGISWTLLDALCIPFMHHGVQHFWNEEEESHLVYALYRILTHPRVQVVGQNILYDCQYTYRHWHFIPRVIQDCMISQHAIFSDLPKALDYQASMYCNYYVYWKDEGKNWDPKMGEDQLWWYNCEDCVYTDEAGQTELEIVKAYHLEEVHSFQQALFWPVLRVMLRGVKIDIKKRDEIIVEVKVEIKRRQDFLTAVLGHPLNPKSPKQMHALFYEDLQQKPVMTRTKPPRPTLNDDALQTIAKREPLLKPIINCIADIRTLSIFLSNFLERDLDEDQRMRCAYNIGGSESGKSAPRTYRLSSNENAFGSGTNLQNIPSEKSKSVGKAVARGAITGLGDPYSYPNIRSIFVPDDGYIFFDGDLDRADLQVVVWEANDEQLKAALRMGVDIHLLNAYVVVGKNPPPMDELVEGHPKYPDHRAPMKMIREFAKVFCHATNYCGKSRTVAAHTGRTVHEIDRAQRIWFGAHPGIEALHKRTDDQIKRFRFVENRFGYRWHIFDRLDEILPEAVAWIPQSTVSVVINRIWKNIDANLPEVDCHVLLQVHDSLPGQYLARYHDTMPARIKAQAKIVIPYEDPLVIPFNLKTSPISWGDCH